MATTTLSKSVLSGQTSELNLFNRMHVYYGKNYITEPAVTGYSFIQFESLPNHVLNASDEQFGQTEAKDAKVVLSAQALSITLPSITISEVTQDTFGGQWITVPGRLDVGKDTTVQFWETHNLDVTQIIREWTFRIRDLRTGAAHVYDSGVAPQTAGSAASRPNYFSPNYKGCIYWYMTDPNIERILLAVQFMGVWPKNLPLDSINTNVTTNDKIELSINFAMDKLWIYPKVYLELQPYWEARNEILKNLLDFKSASGAESTCMSQV